MSVVLMQRLQTCRDFALQLFSPLILSFHTEMEADKKNAQTGNNQITDW